MSKLDLEKIVEQMCEECKHNNEKGCELFGGICNKQIDIRQTLAAEKQAKALESIAGDLKKIANPMMEIEDKSVMTKQGYEKEEKRILGKLANANHHAMFGDNK